MENEEHSPQLSRQKRLLELEMYLVISKAEHDR